MSVIRGRSSRHTPTAPGSEVPLDQRPPDTAPVLPEGPGLRLPLVPVRCCDLTFTTALAALVHEQGHLSFKAGGPPWKPSRPSDE